MQQLPLPLLQHFSSFRFLNATILLVPFLYMQNGLRILYVHVPEALLQWWNNSNLKARTSTRVEEKNSISTHQSTQREYQTVINQVYNRLVFLETKSYSFVTLEEVIIF